MLLCNQMLLVDKCVDKGIGEQGRGHGDCTCLPPTWPSSILDSWPYVGYVCCWFFTLLQEVFFGFSGFSLLSTNNISKFQFDRMKDLPVNHFYMSGVSWVNTIN